MKRSRTVLAAAFVLSLAGCGASGEGSVAAPASGEPAGSAVPSMSASQPSGDPGAGAQDGRCHHGEVKLTAQGAPGGGAAGTQYTWIVLTNTSARTCTFFGYPGVSWVTGDSGQQVNKPAERDTAVAPKQVELAPGRSAHAQVGSPQTGNFGDDCKPVQARGYRVYLPDETAADFVPAEQTVCSADGVGLAHVGPVTVAE